MTVVTELPCFTQHCTGCFACYSACPVEAIHMQMDEEGFYFPTINSSCIQCGKCVSVCPINDEIKPPSDTRKQYSFKGEDDIRVKSSSGGLFWYIAQTVLQEDGVVFGAAFDPNSGSVRHMSSDEVDLERLLRSKYVQSDVGNAFQQVKIALESYRKVLFSGTPCQVRGLKKYLNGKDDLLLTMDFVCHGVPSSGLFRDMLEDYQRKENASIADVTFREKDNGWREQVFKIYFHNGKILWKQSKETAYYYAFLNCITLRTSCFACCNPIHYESDITVMDYWSVKNDDDKGLTGCVINTDKGAAVIENMILSGSKCTFTELSRNSLTQACIPHAQIAVYRRNISMRNRFFRYYEAHGYAKANESFMPRFIKWNKCKAYFYKCGGMVKKALKAIFRKGNNQ